MPHESTPASLLERLRDPGDQLAKMRLVEFCQGYFLCWARTFFTCDQDVEDFLQELFLKVFKNISTFKHDPSKRFRGWLFTMAKHLALEIKAKRERRPNSGLSSPEIPVEDPPPDFIELEFRANVEQKAKDFIRAEFESSTWKAFELVVLEERTAGEAAAELGMSVAAVYMAKSRVLKRLRAELAGLVD